MIINSFTHHVVHCTLYIWLLVFHWWYFIRFIFILFSFYHNCAWSQVTWYSFINHVLPKKYFLTPFWCFNFRPLVLSFVIIRFAWRKIWIKDSVYCFNCLILEVVRWTTTCQMVHPAPCINIGVRWTTTCQMVHPAPCIKDLLSGTRRVLASWGGWQIDVRLNVVPGPPGWGLGLGLTTLSQKNYTCYRNTDN